MSSKSLRSIATKGILWSALDKFSVQGGQFVIGIILARLLMPEDFGLIGMLSIFIVISQTFIDSGMGSGLIQKKDRNDVDFSTVFVFNMGVSLFFYGILFLTAPLISRFYDVHQLVILTRVLALNIIINSLSIVQRSKLIIEFDFKTIAKVNVVSVLTGGILAVYCAFSGFGVWALVIQNLTRAFVSVVMFWLLSHWKPTYTFSKNSFNSLFGFGSKLLISGLYAKALQEVYNIAIGKVYNTGELGFYTRSKQFVDFTIGTVTSVIQQVAYPILATLQDDKERLISVHSRLIKMAAFLMFPILTLLAILAHPFILLLLTEKWAPAVVLLQWMAFARIFYPISVINMNSLNAIGRSDLFLKVDLSKAPLVIIALLVTVPLGVEAIVIGYLITSIISFFIDAYVPGRLFGYGPFQQMKDMIPVFIATGLMAILVFWVVSITRSLFFQLVFGGISGILFYWLVCHLIGLKELHVVYDIIKKQRKR